MLTVKQRTPLRVGYMLTRSTSRSARESWTPGSTTSFKGLAIDIPTHILPPISQSCWEYEPSDCTASDLWMEMPTPPESPPIIPTELNLFLDDSRPHTCRSDTREVLKWRISQEIEGYHRDIIDLEDEWVHINAKGKQDFTGTKLSSLTLSEAERTAAGADSQSPTTNEMIESVDKMIEHDKDRNAAYFLSADAQLDLHKLGKSRQRVRTSEEQGMAVLGGLIIDCLERHIEPLELEVFDQDYCFGKKLKLKDDAFAAIKTGLSWRDD